jgi:arylformamidase
MDAIYRDFDLRALDLEYTPSEGLTGGIGHYLESYTGLSRQALARPGASPDISYGPHPDEILDLFIPDGPAPRAGWPLHVFIHGGYWQLLSQREFAFIGPAFQDRGVAYATVNYTLAPAATIGQMAEQCRRAVAWLYAEAGRLGIDNRRIAISGHSAGAHLCAMLRATDWKARGLPDDVIKSALLISGIYDLEPIRLSFVNEPLNLTPAQVAEWSPMALPIKAHGPVAVVWGENDTAEFKRQSAEFADRLSMGNSSVAARELPALNHFDILFEFLKVPSPFIPPDGA